LANRSIRHDGRGSVDRALTRAGRDEHGLYSGHLTGIRAVQIHRRWRLCSAGLAL